MLHAMLRIILLLTLLVYPGVHALPSNDRSTPHIIQMFDTKTKIANDGFSSETHHVITSDGYILEINRIPNGRRPQNNTTKPVVFLMHGLLSFAVSYVVNGPEKSIAYNLADSGFDVWIGNARGVVNSRNHISLDPDNLEDKMKFFDFTFEEIATIDLPAMIDYILEYTGNEKLNYIGHSQGGTVFLILNSMKPEYNDKFVSVHLLAGVGYMKHFPDTTLRVTARGTDLIYAYAVRKGIVEIFNSQWNELSDSNLERDFEWTSLSKIQDHLVQLYGNEPLVGAAIKQIAHYGQHIRDKRFRRWNYNNLNIIHYGSAIPPEYDLSLITANVTMHYSLNDNLLSEYDVIAMAESMPNTRIRRIKRASFTHDDYLIAADVREMVTDYIVVQMKKRNNLI